MHSLYSLVGYRMQNVDHFPCHVQIIKSEDLFADGPGTLQKVFAVSCTQ